MDDRDKMLEATFFPHQIILLTGGTGGLGGCLLYKLTVLLKVKKIFLLVRAGKDEAIRKLNLTLSGKFRQIQQEANVVFAEGNMNLPGFGFNEDLRKQMEAEVTIVIHAAANISLKAGLRQVVCDNTLPCLELAKMAKSFLRLIRFIHVSSAYACSFVPDGPVIENIYPIDNASRALQDIVAGRCSDWSGYAWPYARSKHLTECLLTEQYPFLPILIVRPSCIGPAIKQPFELYGPPQSIPVDNFFRSLLSISSEEAVFPAAVGLPPGGNVLDEIPVDIVANILLQHAHIGTSGVINACSQKYIPKTLNSLITDFRISLPKSGRSKMANISFTRAPAARISPIAQFYGVMHRNWEFRCDKSRHIRMSGPLGIGLDEHDPAQFMRRRAYGILQTLQQIEVRSKLVTRRSSL